jgi:hypothetical protein
MNAETKIIRLLCKAISTKHLVRFWYESEKNGRKDWRIVAPYVLGKKKTNGNIVVSGYFEATRDQLNRGFSSRSTGFLIKKLRLEQLEILRDRFTRLKLDPKKIFDTSRIEIICRVDFPQYIRGYSRKKVIG